MTDHFSVTFAQLTQRLFLVSLALLIMTIEIVSCQDKGHVTLPHPAHFQNDSDAHFKSGLREQKITRISN